MQPYLWRPPGSPVSTRRTPCGGYPVRQPCESCHQVLTRGGEPYLRSAVERTVDVGGRADEEEGASVVLGRGDDSAWPEPEEAERLLEHDELWQLDAAERAQLCLLLVHQKHEVRRVGQCTVQ